MHTHLSTRSRQFLRIGLLASLCVAASFVVGIESAGDVRPITLIEAGSPIHAGDLNGDGVIDARDAIEVLEIVQGYKVATPAQLQADPDGNGRLTVDDALRILRSIP
ncbi:MAG: dockerin type I repeat-containing protein [Candidatus Peregrinibacteria bacterium]